MSRLENAPLLTRPLLARRRLLTRPRATCWVLAGPLRHMHDGHMPANCVTTHKYAARVFNTCKCHTLMSLPHVAHELQETWTLPR